MGKRQGLVDVFFNSLVGICKTFLLSEGGDRCCRTISDLNGNLLVMQVTDGAKAFRVGSDRTRSQSTTKVSALGCSLSAVIAAFLACTNPASNSNKSDHVSAAVQALGCYQ